MALTVKEFAEKLNLKVAAGEKSLGNEIKGMYIGDLLSWVMGKAKEGDAWITIQGHLNIVAVAMLTSVSCIIVCESAEVNDQTVERADAENIAILTSSLNAFELANEYIKNTVLSS